MKRILSEEQVKELFRKRKYYSEHPEEAKRDYAKRDDGVIEINGKVIQRNK